MSCLWILKTECLLCLPLCPSYELKLYENNSGGGALAADKSRQQIHSDVCTIFPLHLTCGCHVISFNISHVRVKSTVQIILDNFPTVVVACTHEKEGRAAGQRDGFGHEKAHYYGEMEEK